jgi:tRNA pseudouridine38-40 synthase
MMVAHLDSDHIPPDGLEAMAARLNSILPKDVAINRILPVNPSAHARFDAISRTYHYYAGTHKDPFNNDRAYILHGATPDFDAMNLSCRHLADYTDFTSFSKLHSGAKTNNCRIHHAEWTREGDLWRFTITADRFLRNMVRAIVGTLFDIGRGKLPPDALRDVIEARDRAKAGNSAPPHALFLDNIAYPEDVFLDV